MGASTSKVQSAGFNAARATVYSTDIKYLRKGFRIYYCVGFMLFPILRQAFIFLHFTWYMVDAKYASSPVYASVGCRSNVARQLPISAFFLYISVQRSRDRQIPQRMAKYYIILLIRFFAAIRALRAPHALPPRPPKSLKMAFRGGRALPLLISRRAAYRRATMKKRIRFIT